MDELLNELSAGNIGSHVVVFVLGFLLGKKIAKIGFIFMLFLALIGYFIFQSYAGGGSGQ